MYTLLKTQETMSKIYLNTTDAIQQPHNNYSDILIVGNDRQDMKFQHGKNKSSFLASQRMNKVLILFN